MFLLLKVHSRYYLLDGLKFINIRGTYGLCGLFHPALDGWARLPLGEGVGSELKDICSIR